MPVKILFTVAPFAATLVIDFLARKALTFAAPRVDSKALSVGLTILIGGLSYLAQKEFASAVAVTHPTTNDPHAS